MRSNTENHKNYKESNAALIQVEEKGASSGKWLYYSATMMICSVCDRHVPRHKYSYCPHCGKPMSWG